MKPSTNKTLEQDRLFVKLLGELELINPGERKSYLEKNCDDPLLTTKLLAAFDANENDPDFLTKPLINLTDLTGDLLAVEEPKAKQIGPYKIEACLGEGGMGQVFLARQDEPIRRSVALKIMRSSLSLADFGARFLMERQALAQLQHPNIAHLYEAGETEKGSPYFAMEMVNGKTITGYCNQNKLSVAARLHIFIDVCKGIQHAHQNQLTHRDIKPDNILIAEVDGHPVPKIIDFGVSQGMDDSPASDQFNERTRLLATLSYASPEIILGALENQNTASTGSDVYSLGIVLQELLCETMPYGDPQSSDLKNWLDTVNKDACYASECYNMLEPESAEEIATLRSTLPHKLQNEIAGDLDCIIRKSIAPKLNDRYLSVSDLITDIERHLTLEPVLAHPSGRAYIVGKFFRRNRLTTLVISLLTLMLLTGVSATFYEAARARSALLEYQGLSLFILDSFQTINALHHSPDDTTAHELLDYGTKKILATDNLDPVHKVSLLIRITEIYIQVSLHDQAKELGEVALKICETELSPEHEQTEKIIMLLEHINKVSITSTEVKATDP
ncbi:MAG: serine/threonine protein kinase [Gammaproteobacteria bacterium]|nr:serine/threonine protein kinase [Gammaproteobacteria bacterium]